MDSEQRFWISVWAILAVPLCVLIVTVGVTTYNINKKAFENGYESASLQGCGGSAYWVKAK